MTVPTGKLAPHLWASGTPRIYHLPPRDALSACQALNASDPWPFADERLALAAMGLPPLVDDDAPEVTR